jgi:hypothetical protein
MTKRDIIIGIVVLVGIAWLFFQNYHKTTPQTPPAKELRH